MSENNKDTESNLSGKIRACLMIYLLLAFLYILFISLSGVDYQNSTTGFYFVAFTIFFIIFFSVIYYAFEFVAFLLGRYRKNVPWYSKKRNILLVLLMVCTPLNLLGFCYSQFKFYSDEEFIRIAIQHNLKQYERQKKRWRDGERNLDYDLRDLPRTTNLITYSSVDNFIQQNPKCCSIKKFYNGTKLFEGGTYWAALQFHYHVKINIYGYALNPSESEKSILFNTTNYVSCCGIVSDWFGPGYRKGQVDTSRKWNEVHFKFPQFSKTKKE
jgi:hypothetical protein